MYWLAKRYTNMYRDEESIRVFLTKAIPFSYAKKKKICDQRITFRMFIINITRERRESVFKIKRV